MAKKHLSGIESKFVTDLDDPLLPKDAIPLGFADQRYQSIGSGGSGNGNLPFKLSTGVFLCLPTNNGFLPFKLSNGTILNLSLSC